MSLSGGLSAVNVFSKPLNDAPDDEDLRLHEINSDPALITERLRQLVPLFEFIGANVERASKDKTIVSAPLAQAAMNQNGTHQASVFYILADYTLGVAMFAALPGVYTVGVHDRCSALPVQLWLKSGSVKHIKPGRGLIRAETSISDDIAKEMRIGLINEGRFVLRHKVNIYQDDQLIAIAEHEIGVYADRPSADDVKPTSARIDRLKVSALMIAGLRNDSISRKLAGEQGIAIAARMTKATPQLPTLVQARMMHIESEIIKNNYEQVVVLGAGLDPKPLKYASSDQEWFLLDLPEMLSERKRLVSQAGGSIAHTTDIAVDLRFKDWSEKLLDSAFDPTRPTLVVFEGVSMYLKMEDISQLLVEVSRLTINKDSRLWLDHITDKPFQMGEDEVVAFLQNMARLGEPFITGFENLIDYSGADQWKQIENSSAGDVIGLSDVVHREYRFSLLGPVH